MSDLVPTKGFVIQNDSGEMIPPNSIVVVTSVENIAGTSTTPGSVVHHVDQYNNQDGNIYVTGDTSIPIGKQGKAYADQLLYVAVSPTDATPEAGDQWGPVPGKWFLGFGYRGFVAQGESIQNVRPSSPGTYSDSIGLFYRSTPDGWHWAKATSAITSGTFESPTTFTFDIWVRDPDDTADIPALIVTDNAVWLDVTGGNYMSVEAEEGRRLIVGVSEGIWSLKALDCPE